MSPSKVRRIIAVACSGLVLALPAESQACWFTSCFHPAPAACPAPVAPVQQVNYVPQTCYRTVYNPVPVTSYRPITTADPCTGCPVTSLSPVTTYVQRPVVVPYTTYRPVVTTVMMPVAPACPTCSACSACAAPATSYYAPAAVAAPAPSCGCGAPALTSAAVAPALASTAAPTTSYYGGATTAYYSAPATGYGSAPDNELLSRHDVELHFVRAARFDGVDRRILQLDHASPAKQRRVNDNILQWRSCTGAGDLQCPR